MNRPLLKYHRMCPKKAFPNTLLWLTVLLLASFASCNHNKNHESSAKPNDSIEYNRLIKKVDTLAAQYKLDSAYSFLLKIHEWALRSNDSILIARSLVQLGNVNKSSVKMIIAEKHLDEAIAILRRHNKPKLLAEALGNAGLVKQLQGDYQTSQQLLFESLKIAETLKDYERMSVVLNLIGSNLDMTGNKSLAISYFHRAFHLAEKYNFEKAKCSIFTNLGVAYRRNHPDSAKYYYLKVINTKSLPKDDITRIQSEYNLGNIYLDEGNYDKAMSAYQHVRSFSIHRKFPEGIAISINGIACVYQRVGQVPEAIKLLNEAIFHFEKTGSMSIVVQLKQNIIEYYRMQSNYKEIDKLYSSIMQLQDSLMNVNRLANIQNLEFFYQSKKKELLNKQLATELRFARLISAFWLVIFLVVSCCFVEILLYYRKNLKQKYRSLKDLEEWVRVQEKLRQSKSEHAEILEKQIEKKQKELSTLAQQLKLLQDEIISPKSNAVSRNATSPIDDNTPPNSRKNYWENLTMKFNIIYPGFTDKLMASYPNLNTNDIQFCLLIKLNLPLKDIANILNISQYSLYKRKSRLAEKMKLNGKDKDLYSLIQSLQ